MYTRYTDLVARYPVEKSPMLDLPRIILQQDRDTIVRKSMIEYKIGQFPKSKKEFERTKQKLENLSITADDQLVLFFSVRDDQQSPEKECHILRKGIWKKYANSNDAINDIFYVSKDESIVEIMIIQDKNE
jgi:hypothetical protein